ncbi:hypothetical protein QFZ94_006787 [Paraburkholderia sp. JPY465]
MPTIKGCLDALCIPRNDQVCQQRQGARNRDHFVAAPPALRRDLAGLDCALQLMDRFTAIEQRMHFTPEFNVAEVVAQQKRAQQSTENQLWVSDFTDVSRRPSVPLTARMNRADTSARRRTRWKLA